MRTLSPGMLVCVSPSTKGYSRTHVARVERAFREQIQIDVRFFGLLPVTVSALGRHDDGVHGHRRMARQGKRLFRISNLFAVLKCVPVHWRRIHWRS